MPTIPLKSSIFFSSSTVSVCSICNLTLSLSLSPLSCQIDLLTARHCGRPLRWSTVLIYPSILIHLSTWGVCRVENFVEIEDNCANPLFPTSIDIVPANVDVNVHPTKHEVWNTADTQDQPVFYCIQLLCPLNTPSGVYFFPDFVDLLLKLDQLLDGTGICKPLVQLLSLLMT